jgi:hypothetical protein
MRNRSVEKLLICLTDGAILWDSQAQDFDWAETTVIPSCLKGAFPAEPLYAYFRAGHFILGGNIAKSEAARSIALVLVHLFMWDVPKLTPRSADRKVTEFT